MNRIPSVRTFSRTSAAVLLLVFVGCGGDGDTPGTSSPTDLYDLEYEAGQSYFGENNWIEYIPGELPVVVSAPHGGNFEPPSIPDRTFGTTVTDANTIETSEAIRDAFIQSTAQAPHLVISHLRRTKLDPNREIGEAAQGNADAERAWREYHIFIEIAKDAVEEDHGSGLYLDIHGHGHEIPRVEIGYLLSSDDLEQTDATLDGAEFVQKSSLRDLAQIADIPFSELVRGSTSLGGRLESEGFPAVPSPDSPSPGGEPYFTGGYSTARHGSRDGGTVSGAQLELNFPGIRDEAANRGAFGEALAAVVETYMNEHFGFFPE